MSNKFSELFPRKPIIGMIHLSGSNGFERVSRALEELAIYEEERVSGAIIEDYHGSLEDVLETLHESSRQDFKIIMGVNILRNPYCGFELASEFGAKFIQFDSVQTPDLNLKLYEEQRRKYPGIVVLGGVGFKYIKPTGNLLKIDLEEGKSRCEAIVTTGDGTGIETPFYKLIRYKELLNEFPLIVGAGVNLSNIYDQLSLTDGAIVGSYFKPNGNTYFPIDRNKVKALIEIAKQVQGV